MQCKTYISFCAKNKTTNCIGNSINLNLVSMHTSPNIKGIQNSSQKKENKKRPTTYQVGFSKFQPFTWHLRHNAKGQSIISYILAKLFAQKVDSNSRKMKMNCLILAWINISCFKNTWNFFLLHKNIWFFLFFSCF